MKYEKTTADRVKAPDYVDRETHNAVLGGGIVITAVFLLWIAMSTVFHSCQHMKRRALEKRVLVLEEILNEESVSEGWQK